MANEQQTSATEVVATPDDRSLLSWAETILAPENRPSESQPQPTLVAMVAPEANKEEEEAKRKEVDAAIAAASARLPDHVRFIVGKLQEQEFSATRNAYEIGKFGLMPYVEDGIMSRSPMNRKTARGEAIKALGVEIAKEVPGTHDWNRYLASVAVCDLILGGRTDISYTIVKAFQCLVDRDVDTDVWSIRKSRADFCKPIIDSVLAGSMKTPGVTSAMALAAQDDFSAEKREKRLNPPPAPPKTPPTPVTVQPPKPVVNPNPEAHGRGENKPDGAPTPEETAKALAEKAQSALERQKEEEKNAKPAAVENPNKPENLNKATDADIAERIIDIINAVGIGRRITVLQALANRLQPDDFACIVEAGAERPATDERGNGEAIWRAVANTLNFQHVHAFACAMSGTARDGMFTEMVGTITPEKVPTVINALPSNNSLQALASACTDEVAKRKAERDAKKGKGKGKGERETA